MMTSFIYDVQLTAADSLLARRWSKYKSKSGQRQTPLVWDLEAAYLASLLWTPCTNKPTLLKQEHVIRARVAETCYVELKYMRKEKSNYLRNLLCNQRSEGNWSNHHDKLINIKHGRIVGRLNVQTVYTVLLITLITIDYYWWLLMTLEGFKILAYLNLQALLS